MRNRAVDGSDWLGPSYINLRIFTTEDTELHGGRRRGRGRGIKILTS